jgi:hypothetical protein
VTPWHWDHLITYIDFGLSTLDLGLQFSSVSEGETRAELELTHRRCACNDPKGCGCRASSGNGVARLSEIYQIENISTLGSEADFVSFTQTNVASDGQIDHAITGPVEKIARRVAVGGNAGHDPVLGKGCRVEPHCRGWMVEVWIAYQLRTVRADTIKVGIDVAVSNRERKSAAQLDDRRNAPAVDEPACHPILARVEIRPEVKIHAEDVSLVRIACALVFKKLAIVLRQSLSRAVVKLNTAKGLAKGVEGAKRNVVVHAHRAGQLQPMVIGTLV